MVETHGKYDIIDLFAGAGGLSLGAARAGFNVVATIELEEHAVRTHAKNFPHTMHLRQDIMALSSKDILSNIGYRKGELCGVIGGPPCQGFSNIGHRDVNDQRNSLFVRFFELVRDLDPDFYLAENVPGILDSKYNDIRAKALDYVKKYTNLKPFVVVANEYGAPTSRTRIFFIGYKPELFPIGLSTEDFEQGRIDAAHQICVSDSLLGLPSKIRYVKNCKGFRSIDSQVFCSVNEDKRFYYDRICGCVPAKVGDPEALMNYTKHGVVNGCYPTKHSSKVRLRYAKLNYNEQDKVSKSKKLDPDGFCPTLRAGTGPEKGSFQAVRPIHYLQPRVITPREAARLQGFPDWFVLPETIWHSFRQIGNSVSPIVAEKILAIIYQRSTC